MKKKNSSSELAETSRGLLDCSASARLPSLRVAPQTPLARARPHPTMPPLPGRGWLALALLAALALATPASGRFVVEKAGLRVTWPSGAHPRPISMSLANFGTPLYGGQLM